MARGRGVDGSTGQVGGLGSAADTGQAPEKAKRKPKEVLSLPLSKEATTGVRQLADGFNKPQSTVVKDLAEQVDRPIAGYLRTLYEKYEAERRQKLGGLFTPDPVNEVPIEGLIGS